jgi:surface antigen
MAAAIALGCGLALEAPTAVAQHGGGSHGGGGGGFHGGGAFHGGGGFRGGPGFHGFYGHGFYGRGFYGGGFYPWFGLGFYPYGAFDYDFYNPFWDYGPADFYPPAPAYPPPMTYYQPQQSAPPMAQGGYPTDNSRGFYTWSSGVESGTCNRPYLQQIVTNLTGAQPAGLGAGARLGGIAVLPIIGGRIGAKLDLIDQVCATETLEHAPTGTTVRWQSAAGNPVSLEVTRTEEAGNNPPCRDFVATAQFGSHTQTLHSGACKLENGSWQVR